MDIENIVIIKNIDDVVVIIFGDDTFGKSKLNGTI
jgi:ribosomal protein L14E/L6E/L27E